MEILKDYVIKPFMWCALDAGTWHHNRKAQSGYEILIARIRRPG